MVPVKVGGDSRASNEPLATGMTLIFLFTGAICV